MCAGLRTLHIAKYILNEEECRSIGNAGLWWSVELAVTIAVKPPSVVQETLGLLLGRLCGYAAKLIQSEAQ